MYPEIEFVLHRNRIDIYHQGRRHIILGVKKNNRLAISHSDIDVETVTPFLEFVPIDVATTRKEETMALGNRWKKKRTETEVIKATRAVTARADSVSTDQISEAKRDKVLNAILDSWIDNPDQTKAETREETRRISAKHKEPLFAVAGVRAALTRGTYGSYDKLLASRRRARVAAAKK